MGDFGPLLRGGWVFLACMSVVKMHHFRQRKNSFAKSNASLRVTYQFNETFTMLKNRDSTIESILLGMKLAYMWENLAGQIMRVLLIEDDRSVAKSIEMMLKVENFSVYTTDMGEEGIDLGKVYDYEIILLDLNLPDMSGYEVLRALRVSRIKTPVLILSGLGSIEDKVKGLGVGADDYITKPFHKDELIARMRAIIRRSQGHAQPTITAGDLVVNLDEKSAYISNARIHLTAKEFQILEFLALRKGSTLTKEMILNQLYNGMDEPELKIIDVFVCKLRKKLASASGGQDFIETVWGRGYMLREEGKIPELMVG